MTETKTGRDMIRAEVERVFASSPGLAAIATVEQIVGITDGTGVRPRDVGEALAAWAFDHDGSTLPREALRSRLRAYLTNQSKRRTETTAATGSRNMSPLVKRQQGLAYPLTDINGEPWVD
jgi:hypothetical protein